MENEEIIWPPGIPEYKEEDLMTKANIHHMGIILMIDLLKRNEFTILSVEKNYGSNPSFVLEKDKKKIAVTLMVDIAPKIPELGINKYNAVEYAASQNLIPYFASVSIRSIDQERTEKSLALINDDFGIDNLIFEEVDIEYPEINTEEYYKYKNSALGNLFLFKKFEELRKLLTNNCVLNNLLTKIQIEGIDDIIDYSKENLDDYTPISFGVVKTDGMFGEFKTNELIIENAEGKEEIFNDAKVKYPQDPDKYLSIINYKENIFANNIPAIMLNCDFDEQGKISKISIVDPRHFKYKY